MQCGLRAAGLVCDYLFLSVLIDCDFDCSLAMLVMKFSGFAKQRSCVVRIACLALVLVLSGHARADDVVAERMAKCAAVLIPDEINKKFSGSVSSAFRDAICGEWYKSHKEESDAALGANAVIEAIPVGAKFSQSGVAESLDRGSFCADSARTATVSEVASFFSRIVPAEGRAQWATCIAAVMSRPGVHPIVLSFSPSLNLSISFDANFGGQAPVLTGIETSNLRCGGAHVLGLLQTPPIRPEIGAGSLLAVPCSADGLNVGSVIVHTTRGDEVASVTIPAAAIVNVEMIKSRIEVEREEDVCGALGGWTTDMDGWESDKGDGRCTHTTTDGKWCKGDASAVLEPQFGGELTSPRFACKNSTSESSGSGSCAWNAIGDNPHTSFSRTSSGGWRLTTWIGSKSVALQVCAHERKMREVEYSEAVPGMQNFGVTRGQTFVVSVPKDARRAVVNVQAGGSAMTFLVGENSGEFSVQGSPVDAGASAKWIYKFGQAEAIPVGDMGQVALAPPVAVSVDAGAGSSSPAKLVDAASSSSDTNRRAKSGCSCGAGGVPAQSGLLTGLLWLLLFRIPSRIASRRRTPEGDGSLDG